MTIPNYRTLNIDLYDPESPLNFPLSTLLPPSTSSSQSVTDSASAAQVNTQIRGLLRSGDSVGALALALSTAPQTPEVDDATKTAHLGTVMEVLQGVRQSEASRVIQEMLQTPGGDKLADTLMKYVYRGMAGGKSVSGVGGGGMSPQATGFSQIQARNLGESGGGVSGQSMSVLLSWHEKLVEIVGVGGIVRVMCDRRTV